MDLLLLGGGLGLLLLLAIDHFSFDIPSLSTAGCHCPGSSCLPKARPAVRLQRTIARIILFLERCMEICSGSIAKGAFDYKSWSSRQRSAFCVSHRSPYELPKYIIVVCSVPQREERDGHDGHGVVRVLHETRNGQCMNSEDRGTGRYYGYLFATSARCLRQPMKLF